ncbi:helix-turn-helix domain-containing protein [Streptomyces sp. NBC_01476]|uniref:helix-turn-helix domain-containing protein n=1 Tax=Streptomyces sp. NBC_01476 TaxID=2903881 RepID=UPI002E361596|nr:helix-turn-helix transcriptional regulator [Streptomyces sp. NBC_01476]
MTLNGDAVRALREAQKLSLRKLACLTGRHRSHLSRIERGLAGASSETEERIARALGVPEAAITHKETT